MGTVEGHHYLPVPLELFSEPCQLRAILEFFSPAINQYKLWPKGKVPVQVFRYLKRPIEEGSVLVETQPGSPLG